MPLTLSQEAEKFCESQYTQRILCACATNALIVIRSSIFHKSSLARPQGIMLQILLIMLFRISLKNPSLCL